MSTITADEQFKHYCALQRFLQLVRNYQYQVCVSSALATTNSNVSSLMTAVREDAANLTKLQTELQGRGMIPYDVNVYNGSAALLAPSAYLPYSAAPFLLPDLIELLQTGITLSPSPYFGTTPNSVWLNVRGNESAFNLTLTCNIQEPGTTSVNPHTYHLSVDSSITSPHSFPKEFLQYAANKLRERLSVALLLLSSTSTASVNLVFDPWQQHIQPTD